MGIQWVSRHGGVGATDERFWAGYEYMVYGPL